MFGIVYAANQRKDSIDRDKEKNLDYDAMEITTNTLNLDFVKCGEGGTTHSSCADYYKLKALSEHTQKEQNRLYFFRLFGESEINVTILKNISFNQDNEVIQLYNVPETEEKQNTIKVITPITVKDPVSDINYFALMEVSIFR